MLSCRKSNQGNQDSNGSQKNNPRTKARPWKQTYTKKEHRITKNNTYKETKVNEQFGLHKYLEHGPDAPLG